MKLKLLHVQGRGAPLEECVHLSVVEDCDLGHYQILDTTKFANGMISNKARHYLWLPSIQVKAGDTVIVYTGVGTNRSVPVSLSNQVHFAYWQLGRPVWNDDGDTAVLQYVPEWETAKVNAPPLALTLAALAQFNRVGAQAR